MGYPPPPSARPRRARAELTFDAWILAETNLLFGEWVEANAYPPKPDPPPAPPPMRIDTGYLRSSLPKAPVGGTAEVRPLSRYPTFDEKLAAQLATARQRALKTPFDDGPPAGPPNRKVTG